jgi:CBS domain-containing membrane protein
VGDRGVGHARRQRRGGAASIVLGLARRVRLDALAERHDARTVLAAFSFVNGVLAIGVMAVCALVTRQPFVFPSLGPTAFLFFSAPTTAAASPRNTIYGHAIGVASGYLALAVFGLADDATAMTTEITGPRVGAAALSLGLTSGLMVLARAPHPPAGATTMIVSLGIISEPGHLMVLMAAVVALTLQALVINRAAGIDVSWWRAREPADP